MSIKKIQCLDTLFDKLRCRVEIFEFLRDEKLIADDDMQRVLNEMHNTHATHLFNILETLQREDNVQLVDYEWTLLPKELIKLTIVTSNTKKEFTYTV